MDEQLYENTEPVEKVILVGVDTEDNENIEESIDELEELASTAGAVTLDRVIQKRENIHPSAYLGKGKIEELKNRIIETGATGIICDDELSPAQMRNLEKMLECKVMDRTMLILDIFAQRAKSKEGKIQVELAQLRYRLSRLAGVGTALSRLGGGIGTRGPGEKKLETDRRHIRNRISQLKAELEEIETHRELIRTRRKKVGTPLVAIVGYTNAGKSTLLNTLSNADVLAEDKLFATLDPTTRSIILPGGSEVLITDTVGFIRKLPHHLIKAFRSTLEEAQYADILLHVVDGTSQSIESHMKTVYETLEKLNALGKPILTLFNKMDVIVSSHLPLDPKAEKTFKVSARTSEGLNEVLQEIEKILKANRKTLKALIPYSDMGMLQLIRGQGEKNLEEYREEGIYIEANVNEEVYRKLKKYIVE
ncbi:GTPase HflX [Defluviitalea raffinosedens]|uniref:GTPase HflX n=1 Tax=Defluviitalea raffinosedens TaxID=1450156 RepID=UPI001E052EAC|nr:GTP-binding protein HflX [Defluviitalea raffinosedens]MBZ4669197.1 hflX [Defluviitaleaceae bacterium]